MAPEYLSFQTIDEEDDSYQDKEYKKARATLVEQRDIRYPNGLVARLFTPERIRLDDYFLAPTRMPPFHTDGIHGACPRPIPRQKGRCGRAVRHRYTVMDADTVTPEAEGLLLTAVSHCQISRR